MDQAVASKSNTCRPGVLLVSMPWGPIMEPSLGASILKSVCRRAGIACDVYYAQMRMLKYLSYETYYWLARFWAVNDFVFSSAADNDFSKEISTGRRSLLEKAMRDHQGILEHVHHDRLDISKYMDKVLRTRQDIVPLFLDDIMQDLDFSRYAFVGFSCIADQTIASIAFAQKIKKHHPHMKFAFGGYPLNPPIGPALQRAFPEVMDYVAYNDGEPVIVPLYEAVIGERAIETVPNISYFDEGCKLQWSTQQKLRVNLNDSPTPDYDDYFHQRNRVRDTQNIELCVAEIPVESSRGCWWGERSHCAFCGTDNETLRYREKFGDVTIRQMDELNARYGIKNFRFSDYIMPRTSLSDLLPKLAKRGAPYILHFETKSNLTQEDIELSAKAGVAMFQPGIESFSTPVLKLMKKGARAMQNIVCIYNMVRSGIHVYYNILWGNPGELPEHYEKHAELLPAISHFPLPTSVVSTAITRFSPIAESPETFGFDGPFHLHSRYNCVFTDNFYQKRVLNRDDWAYYFDRPECGFPAEIKWCYDLLQHQWLRWKERRMQNRAKLIYNVDCNGALRVVDTRYSDTPQEYVFSELHTRISEVMPGRVWTAQKLLAESQFQATSPTEFERALNELLDCRIVLADGDELAWIAFRDGENLGLKARFDVCDIVCELPGETRLKPPNEWGEWND